MYKWAIAIIPFCIVVHPRKCVGLSYLCLYLYNSSFRLLLMQTYRDRRPCWDLDVSDVKCKCGFGKPSGHASNSTMLYAIIFYEFWWRFPLRKKGWSLFLSIVLYYWILLSILWSRLYYSAHTFSQVIIGHLTAAILFFFYVFFQQRVYKFFYSVLNFKVSNIKALIWSLVILIFCLGVWAINEAFYELETSNTRTPGRCLECFDGLESHGKENLYALAYTVLPPAVFLGLLIKGRNKKEGEEEDLVNSSD